MTLIKKIYLLPFIFLIISCVLPVSVSADYYQYTDKNGNVSFTDNLSDVPESQREKIKPFSTLDNKEKSKADLPADKEIEKNDKVYNNDTDGVSDELDRVAGKLEKKKQELNQKQQRLNERQYQLKQKALENMTEGERETHRKKIKALNQEIDQYRKQRNLFKEKVKEYNRKVQKKISETE